METNVGRRIALCVTALLLVAMAGQNSMAQNTLVVAGSAWKYLDDGSDQDTAWYGPAFDDSGWASGPAELGYGDGDEATVVSFGPSPNNKYVTTYFRHSFNVPDASIYQNVTLNVKRDDGVVVYLNGNEVFRDNMPAGIITYMTRSVSAVEDNSFHSTKIDASNLVSGTNVLAVEIHQQSGTSSDISFDLSLEASTNPVPKEQTLVATGSVWKYLDNGSDQGMAWYGIGFDDSGWASGPAELGYGDGDEATVVSFGPNPNNKYITTYFRHTFSVSDPSLYQNLILRILRDDGAVVYLNGVEIFRTNMPEGTITYATWALSPIGGSAEDEFIVTAIDASHLVAGENLLAVEVHQNQPNSSDISFDLTLTIPTEPVPEEETLVAAGSVWKYLDDGSDQGTAWYGPAFDDSGWASGPAELGYGDGDEATVVSFGPSPDNKYITTYFRHIFSVSDPSKHQNLILRILRDDGAVVYLNGVEVFRTNMPGGPVTYTTFALSAIGGSAEDEFIVTAIDASYLVAGTNLLAVEVHQDRPNSSDISFDLILVGTTGKIGPVITSVLKGPYLIYPGDNTKMQVLWQLQSPVPHTLRWGQDTSYSEGSATPGMYGDNQYKHTITGVTAGARYYYEVEDVGVGSFLAAPPDDATDVKFLVYGDCRSNPAVHDAVNAGMIVSYTIDPAYQTFTMLTGDWVGSGDRESDWTEQFFNRSWSNTIQLQANLPINGCIGNHEDSGRVFDKYWPYPYERGGRYWSFDYGPAHIVVIDLKSEREGLGAAQKAWLEADLAASTKEWKFLQFHSPIYSAAASHQNNMIEQAFIQSLCETYGVEMVFCGHNHYYAHCDVNGVKHITAGGGGAPLGMPNPSYHPSIVTASSTYHFCKVDIHGLQLDFEAVQPDGTVIDAFTLYHVDDTTAQILDANAYALSYSR